MMIDMFGAMKVIEQKGFKGMKPKEAEGALRWFDAMADVRLKNGKKIGDVRDRMLEGAAPGFFKQEDIDKKKMEDSIKAVQKEAIAANKLLLDN